MTGYDLIVAVVFAVLAVQGLRRGLIGELAGLVALAMGLVLAFRYDGRVGDLLARLVPRLTTTEARIVAFLAILAAVGVVAGYLVMRLNDVIARVPVVTSLNRVGGLAVGALLALVFIWLLTSSLLLLPSSLVPFSAAVHRSATVRILRGVTPQWDRDLRVYLDNFTAGRSRPG